MLKTTYIRDGHNRIIGNTTSGFASGDVVARDQSGTRANDEPREAVSGDAWLMFRPEAENRAS